MTEPVQVLQVEITPFAPDTVSSVKSELTPLIEQVLRETQHEDLLKNSQIQVEIEKTFPIDEAIVVAISLGGKIAYDVWRDLILPRLKSRYSVREKSKKDE